VHALFAFLHYREVHGLGRIEVAGKEALEDELVVPVVGELAAGPADFSDAFRHLAVEEIIGFLDICR